MMKILFLLVSVPFWSGGICLAASVPEKPPWTTNSSLVRLRGVIWPEQMVASKPLEISLLIKNVSKGDVYVCKKFNSGNYMYENNSSVRSMHGDGEGARLETDYRLLKSGEVMVFTWPYFHFPSESGEWKLRVRFHNNEPAEKDVPPQRDGIPIVNDLDYNFGTIIVLPSNNTGAVDRSHP